MKKLTLPKSLPGVIHWPTATQLFLVILMLSFSLGSVTPANSQPTVQSDFDCNQVTQIPVAECEALVALYENTNGPNWSAQSGWLENNTPCSWFGVACSEDHIVGLNLSEDCWWTCDYGINLRGSIPPEIGNLTQLSSFDLGYNQVTGLPSEIGNLSNLQSINLVSNGLQNFPPEIINISSLEQLTISENQITSLPEGFGNLSNLNELNLSSNLLNGLPTDFGNLSDLEELYLNNNQFSTFSTELYALTNLYRLSMADNQISSLPAEIGNLTNLVYLHLGSNLIQDLPSEIGNLVNLVSFYLGENQISNLPVEIGNFSKLETLNLAHNQLNSLPASILGFRRLQYMDLSDNLLSNLPVEITSLGGLQTLSLHYNRLWISDPVLLDYLQRFDSDWEASQTIPPVDFRLFNFAPGSLHVVWSPIQYTDGGGYYELSYATDPAGPYTTHGITPYKISDHYLLDNLPDSPDYYVRIRTFSPANGWQHNDLWSDYSQPLVVLSTPLTPDTDATLETTAEDELLTRLVVPVGAVSDSGRLVFSPDPGANLYFPIIYTFAGKAFNLGWYQEDGYTQNTTLLSPMTITQEYVEPDLGEENLRLFFWDPVRLTWIDAIESCSPAGEYEHHPEENYLAVTACGLGKYALVVKQPAVFLPAITLGDF